MPPLTFEVKSFVTPYISHKYSNANANGKLHIDHGADAFSVLYFSVLSIPQSHAWCMCAETSKMLQSFTRILCFCSSLFVNRLMYGCFILTSKHTFKNWQYFYYYHSSSTSPIHGGLTLNIMAVKNVTSYFGGEKMKLPSDIQVVYVISISGP